MRALLELRHSFLLIFRCFHVLYRCNHIDEGRSTSASLASPTHGTGASGFSAETEGVIPSGPLPFHRWGDRVNSEQHVVFDPDNVDHLLRWPGHW